MSLIGWLAKEGGGTKRRKGKWALERWLGGQRALAALEDDPDNHVEQFTSTSMSSSKGSNALLGLCRYPEGTHVHR